jgi:GNAT superfamily N-acetyltransferase
MGFDMGPTPVVESAGPGEREAAFRLIFQHLPEPERERRIGNALRLLELGELNAAGLFVVRGRQGLRGAMICLPVPGASGLVWPPQSAGDRRRIEVEDALASHASAWLRQRGAKLAQALLVPEEAYLAVPLERNGFRHITSLLYMRHAGVVPFPGSASHEDLVYLPVDAVDLPLFQQTLVRTYDGTLDCPEVSNVRDIREVIEGHRAQGHEGTDHWWLILEQDCPVGVLLATASAEWDSWDIAYVGVVPEARRRGLGREVVRRALLEARAAEASQVTLSVDARNEPALQLYERLGFERYDRREVYLAIWRTS